MSTPTDTPTLCECSIPSYTFGRELCMRCNRKTGIAAPVEPPVEQIGETLAGVTQERDAAPPSSEPQRSSWSRGGSNTLRSPKPMQTMNETDKPCRSLGSHQSARMISDVWLTPREILAPLGAFDLDPCTIADHPWPVAPRFFTKEADGLRQPWEGRAWVNPPFGSEAGKWLSKLADHGNGIALVAARTETRWFVEAVWKRATAVCFLHGRPHFHYADGRRGEANSGAPIALVAYGVANALTLAQSGLGTTLLIPQGGAR